MIRLGVIGLGNMGTGHCRLIQAIPALQLVAVADVAKKRVEKLSERYECAGFSNGSSLIQKADCDAVLIATPHFDHTSLGVQALRKGLHVMMEKPLSVHKADCEKLLRIDRQPGQQFAAMFNQRTNPNYRTIRQWVLEGKLGRIHRFQWTITDWFRPESYYQSGGWRATWAGEGGGVLLNQSPHQLDLLQWIFGMPDTVQAFCQLGKYHDIEVEDAVTARLSYASGTEGLFITTTGEAPGVNRLEIAADEGLVVYDTRAGQIEFLRNSKPVSQAIRENGPFESPDVTATVISTGTEGGEGSQHKGILENFAAAIAGTETLIAPAEEGIHSVELANAMLLSSAKEKPVALPISSRAYSRLLNQRIATSRYQPDEPEGKVEDVSKSF